MKDERAFTARRGQPITAVHESEHSQDILFCLTRHSRNSV
jgi:hypothetical protein